MTGCCKAFFCKRQTNIHGHVADLGASHTQGVLLRLWYVSLKWSVLWAWCNHTVIPQLCHMSTAHGIAGVQTAAGREMLNQ